jgi:hypothetical protein
MGPRAGDEPSPPAARGGRAGRRVLRLGRGSATRRLTLATDAIARLPFPSDILSGLEANSGFGLTVHRLADGGIALAYTPGREVRVRRAAPEHEFGPPQRLSRVPRGSTPHEV